MREHKGKSIIALPDDYVVIDTETTGLDYNFCDLIEVSAMRFRDNVCVDSFTSLVRPPLNRFCRLTEDGTIEHYEGYVDDFISNLTGITNDMLADAPRPEVVIPIFLEFIGDSILIGHNAHYDINFLYDAADNICGIPLKNDFVDTLRIARKVFPELKHHRLSDVADACAVTADGAHRAEADCRTTVACYQEMRRRILEAQTEDEFIGSFVYNYGRRLASVVTTTDDIDPTNPIYQKSVVFTGTLSAMSRKEAFQVVANLGGNPQNSINSKTNYLFIGSAEFIASVKE